ncbi:Tripartite motif-containing protein 45, partial [Habropoda laboriosa]
CFNEAVNNGSKTWKCGTAVSHARQAQERIQEFNRLKRARQLLDAISLTNELLTDGSDVEILSLASTIVTRLKILGVFNISLENGRKSTRTSTLKPSHIGIYHCCTFCSSGGKKEVTCGCGGTMPGGYQGCGHGHIGHPGVHHWSCCGSILRYGDCLALQKYMHQLLF